MFDKNGKTKPTPANAEILLQYFSKEQNPNINKTVKATPLALDHIIKMSLVNQYAYASYADTEYIESLPIPFIVIGRKALTLLRSKGMLDDGTVSNQEGDRRL